MHCPISKFSNNLNLELKCAGTVSVRPKFFGDWRLEPWNFRDLDGRGWLNILEMRSVEHCEHA
jgi:hypothetical protein